VNLNDRLLVGEAWSLFKNSEDVLRNMSWIQYAELVEGWEIYPISKEGHLVAAIVMKENQSHVCCNPSFKGAWFSRQLFNVTVGQQIKHYGVSRTSCFIDSPNKGFIKRLGYQYKETINGVEHYESRINRWSSR